MMIKLYQSIRGHKINWPVVGRGVVVLALIIGLLLCTPWLYWRLTHVTTDAAYVKADMASVAPEVPGKITAVLVKEGQTIRQGQVLLRIDPEQMERQVGMADAELAGIYSRQVRYRAEWDQAKETVPATIGAARAALDAAREQKVKAEANLAHRVLMYQRFKELYAKEVIGKAKYDEMETAWRVAEADGHAAAAQVALCEARLREAEAARSAITKSEAAYREVTDNINKAKEAQKLARLSQARCEVKAPIDGVVARILVREGDFASPGRPVVAVYNPATRYIEARFEETKVRFITPGKKVEFTVDHDPDRALTGKVISLTPASAAEFALIPRDISAGEFTKVVQRIPVRIAIDHLEQQTNLVPGMSCEVAISRNKP
jgi:membrane fusion protein, multidrug efflux system